MKTLSRAATYPLAKEDSLAEVVVPDDTRFRWTGELRPVQVGEWYLENTSGKVEARRAPCDLSYLVFAAVPILPAHPFLDYNAELTKHRKVFKTTITVTLLHEADSLEEAQQWVDGMEPRDLIEEIESDTVVGSMRYGDTVAVLPQCLEDELAAVGNDGTFFSQDTDDS